MKKLTAGIFASILGLTAIGAADAAVPSTKYVDDAVAAAQLDIADTYATKTALETEESARAQADLTLQGNIDTLTTNTTNALADKADKSYVGTIPSTSSSTNVVDYVAEKTTGIATSGEITSLQNRVTAIEGDYVTEQELTDSQAAQNTNITAAANAASAADIKAGNAQAAADNAAAAASTADGKAVAAQTAANEAKDAAATADGKAVAAQTTANEAKDAAAAAAKISTQKGNDGVYVLTATVAGDSTTYKWEVITRTGSETDETTTTSEPAGDETTGA